MGCILILEQLAAFCCGGVAAADRAGIEAHLAGCPACLAEFFALKRDLELGRHAGERPPAATRARIFAAAAAWRAARGGPAERPLLARSAALLAGTLAAALAAAVLLGQVVRSSGAHAPTLPVRGRAAPSFDSGRQAPGNLNVL